MTKTNLAGQQAETFFSARMMRLLKISVILMSVLIAGMLVALVFGMKRQMDKLSSASPVAETINVELPGGAKLQSVAAGPEGGVWLYLTNLDGKNELRLLNVKGQLVRRINLEQALAGN